MATSFLTQSKYYSPSLNAAIFDGPIKIYFSQHQEELALKIYCGLQKKLNKNLETHHPDVVKNIYLMLYPTSESFYMSFDKSYSKQINEKVLVVEENLGEDIVLGIRGPIDLDKSDDVYNRLETIFSQKMPELLPAI